MKVIIDASPLISLAVINQLELLKKLFPEIIIPQAVFQEITAVKDRKCAVNIVAFIKNWVRHAEQKSNSKLDLGKGESEAINIYLELKADLLIIDDKKARNAAESQNIKCIGTLGLLTLAKKKGFIRELRKHFIQLLKNRRYFSYQLLNQVLEMNREKPLKRIFSTFSLPAMFRSIINKLKNDVPG
jgi:predicted nucleic acid-binding protein